MSFNLREHLKKKRANADRDGTCVSCFLRPRLVGRKRCAKCGEAERLRSEKLRRAAGVPAQVKQPAMIPYSPIDEVMSRPAFKVLRTLRRQSPDWVEFDDLPLLCEVSEDDRIRNTFWNSVRFHVKQGNIERAPGAVRSRYRITPRGISTLAAMIARTQPLASDFEDAAEAA